MRSTCQAAHAKDTDDAWHFSILVW